MKLFYDVNLMLVVIIKSHCDLLHLSLQDFYFISLFCFLTNSNELQINSEDGSRFWENKPSIKNISIVTLHSSKECQTTLRIIFIDNFMSSKY